MTVETSSQIPKELAVTYLKNSGKLNFSVSILDQNAIGIPNRKIILLDEKSRKVTKKLQTDNDGAVFFTIKFGVEKTKFVKLVVPGSNLVWSRLFFKP